MARTPSRILYDIKGMTIYDRATGEIKGFTPCLASATIEQSGGLNYQYCAGRLPVAAEPQVVEAKISGSLKSLDDFLFEYLVGASIVQNSAEATGSVGTPENVNGTSMVDATTGIASAAVDSVDPTQVKTQYYILKAASATTFDVYAANDINGETLLDDENLINSAPITLPGTGGTVVIPGTGIELTGGSGAISLTIGDTCLIETRHYNNPGSSIISISGDVTLQAFGAILATTRSSGDVVYIDCPYVSPSGAFNVTMEDKAFSVNDFEAAILKDSTKGYAYKMTFVRGSGS